MPTTVDQYCINVTDLDRSVRFYKWRNAMLAAGFATLVAARIVTAYR